MYRIVFAITFAGIMWPGLAKVESLVAARAKSLVVEAHLTIGIISFLKLRSMGNVVIIDMRQPEDYARSHIKDATSVYQIDSVDTYAGLYDRLEKARLIILYSNDGVSDQMRQYAKTLSKRGIQAIAFYTGGFREWVGTGQPVEKGNLQNH